MKNRDWWNGNAHYHRTSFSVIPERVSITTSLNEYDNGSYVNSNTKYEVVDGYGDSWLLTDDRLKAEKLKNMLNSLTDTAKKLEYEKASLQCKVEEASRKIEEHDRFKDVGIALVNVMQFVNDWKAKHSNE